MSMVKEEYGERMVKIVNCESTFDVNRHNRRDKNGGSFGLFQINAPWIPTAKKMGLDIMKPEDNFKFAKHIIKMQGLNAWSCNKLV